MQTATASNGSPTRRQAASDIAIIAYDEAVHYEMLALWWAKAHSVTFLPRECVPPTTFITARDGEPLAAVSYYMMRDVPIAQIAFAITCNGVPGHTVTRALEMCIACAVSEARTELCGEGFIWAAWHDPVLHRQMLRRHGFSEAGMCSTSHLIIDPAIDPDMISGET